MNIGERIRMRREQLGMSVEELAKTLSKNRATVYRYENGDIQDLPLSVLPPISEALRCSIPYLMGWDDQPEQSSSKFGTAVFRDRLTKILDTINTADAEASGINIKSLQNIASGKYLLSFDMACLIADELGESLDYLSGLIKKRESAVYSELVENHISLYDQLTPEQQKLVDAQIKGILQTRE